jgi:hypothetical protein
LGITAKAYGSIEGGIHLGFITRWNWQRIMGDPQTSFLTVGTAMLAIFVPFVIPL